MRDTTAGSPWKSSWLSSDRLMPRLLARPLRIFLEMEAAGGVVLLVATAAALLWANSPVQDSYEALWHTPLTISLGAFQISEDLRHWVNDALMTLFFFVVGLEIKRELVTGELNTLRKAMLPAVAAVGGMVLPAAIYAAFNRSGPAAAGWGIPMATDIAFAVGVLALFGSRIHPSLKVFLLSLAIVDDIGAILVIAVFYSSGIQWMWLLAALGGAGIVVALRRANVYWVPIYVVVGSFVWLATFESGVHATLAGVALGLLTPARPRDPAGFADVAEEAARLPAEPDAEALRMMGLQGQETVSVAERLQHQLHPWTSFVVIPVFALANAGVALTLDALRAAASSSVTLGIIAGLVVGKLVGVAGMSFAAVKLNLAQPPAGIGRSDLAGAAAVAGIGFTVSLFITNLAFTDPQLVEEAKVGVLAGSLIAGLTGAAILAAATSRRGRREAQPVPTYEGSGPPTGQ